MSQMLNLKNKFKDITYWEVSRDEFNEVQITDPVIVKGFWVSYGKSKDDTISSVEDADIVLVEQDVAYEAYLFNGVSTEKDPTTIDAVRVIKKKQLTDLNQNYVMTKVWASL
jgi:hypothetical protein